MGVDGVGANLGFKVTRENVLDAYRLFQGEADRLTTVLTKNAFKLRIDRCGDDPVSQDAVDTFNPKLSKLRAQCTSYVQDLANAAEELKRTAVSYGYTDEQIAHSLGSPSAGPPPPPGPGDAASLLAPYVPPVPADWTPLPPEPPSSPDSPDGEHPPMGPPWTRLFFVAALLLGLAGCGGPAVPPPAPAPLPSQSASPLPPRPAELRLDTVNPCALLTDAQRGELHMNQGKFSYDEDSTRYPVCQWDNSPQRPQMTWLGRLQLRQGADYALDSATGHQIVQVGGFTAVQTSADGQDPRSHCILLVDVAQGQSLWVQYANIFGDFPGLTHERSCQFARAAAEDMVANLRSLAH